MRYLIILFLFFALTNSNAQPIDYYQNVMDNKTVTIHDDSTKLKYIFDVKKKKIANKAMNKTYYWYKGGKIMRNQGAFDGKVLHGNFSAFYPNKTLAEKGQFKDGLKNGLWQEWRTDGTLQTYSYWKKSNQTGKYAFFNESGLEIERGRNINGQKHGKISILSADTTAHQYFDKGKEISQETYIQQNVFRRSGAYLKEQWKKLFNKKATENTIDSVDQLSN
jgi:antitoxin component YwqK of YwqJK toxin-antitoxin module